MNGEHGTDTYSQKKYNHIFYESQLNISSRAGRDNSCNRQHKRKESEGHNNYTLYYKPAGWAYA